ncbi:MAG TPA: class I SAM-dependent methyltransferase [Chloroflexota bacterium]|nr:class I SAM-dependent methyltransferase [Chloroflexota bacterium]
MSDRGSDPTVSYDRLVPYYVWEHRHFQDDIPLYLGFARSSSGPILDAGCGTGRVLLALAREGHTVAGVDSSAGMLDVARERVAAEGLGGQVTLTQADLRTMRLDVSFGMALVALSSFQHLVGMADQRRALERLSAHLQTGGLLVMDVINPSPEWLSAGDGTLVHQYTAPFPDDDGPDTMSKFVARTTLFEQQREQWLLIYDRTTPDGTLYRQSFDMETQFLFRYEAELLLANAGLRLRDLYGDYDLEPYQADSPRMILVAEKR